MPCGEECRHCSAAALEQFFERLDVALFEV
jgi:hypothetical protein